MKRYISFLRGVNMAGHNSIRMNDLSELYRDLGFDDPKTYIQSGNVIFSNYEDLSVPDIAIKIEKAIFEKFSYKIAVIIRTPEELRKIISNNPFLCEDNFDPSRNAVMFLSENPMEAQINKVINIDYTPDKFKITGSEIFIYCPNGFGKTKLYTNFFEKKMGVTGTARNLKTIDTILDLAKKGSPEGLE
jgi:uncharacterized protein (DUF1697 family)